MRFRTLGNTGLTVSEIGFGTIPILSGDVPVLPEYHSPDVKTAVSIMQSAYDMGCNFFDTAGYDEYGDAEYKLGVFLQSVPREKIIVSDKVRKYTKEEMRKAVLASCDRLGTHPDIYFVHQVDERNADTVFSEDGALNALFELKNEGVIRFTGIASHYYSVLERASLDPRVDVLQISGNILECGMLNRMKENRAMIEKGVILNKVYAAGLLTQEYTPEELIGGILHYPIASALIGIGTHEEAEAAMRREYAPCEIPFDDVFHYLSRRHDIVACDRCQKCVCRYRHELFSIVRYFNYMQLGKEEWAKMHLRMYMAKVKKHCTGCKDKPCMSSCPQNLNFTEVLDRISEALEPPYPR